MQYCNSPCKILLLATGGRGRDREYSHYSEMILLDISVPDKSQLSNNFKYIKNSKQPLKQLSQKDYSL